MVAAGTLYVCGTPIGNLDDASYRLVRTLQDVNLIAAEDTRHTRKLLAHFEIHTDLTSYHAHNEEDKVEGLLTTLRDGGDVALVSDAGMPGISDPGFFLIRAAIDEGIKVVPIPGPSAGLLAVVVSGLPSDRFIFEGFLPRSGKDRQQRLDMMMNETRTVVLYESPHRVMATLKELQEHLGNRRVAVARELTKSFEEVRRGSIDEVIMYFGENKPRGEFVIVVEGGDSGRGEQQPLLPENAGERVRQLRQQVQDAMAVGQTKKQAIRQVAVQYGVARREVYEAVKDLPAEKG